VTTREAHLPSEVGPKGRDLRALYTELCALREAVADAAARRLQGWQPDAMPRPAPSSWSGTDNLAAYLALRTHDVRDLQVHLADLGLSSLGRCEAHVLPTLDALIAMLDLALDGERRDPPSPRVSISEASARAQATLQRNSTALFGYPRERRHPRIMVTLPSEAADDRGYVQALVTAGMDCARINCGHDTPPEWVRMADNVRAAAAETGRSCTVLMDLSGPRLRTGTIGPGPAVARVHPRRDAVGNVTEPGTLILDGTGAAGCARGVRGDEGRVAVPASWIEGVQPGDTVEVTDLPGRRRTLRVVDAPGPQERRCQSNAGCFLGPGLELRHHPAGGGPVSTAVVGPVDARPAVIRVAPGDTLILTRDADPGRPAHDPDGSAPQPARVPIGVPEAIDHLRPGHRVFIDGAQVLEDLVHTGVPTRAEITDAAAAEGAECVMLNKGPFLLDGVEALHDVLRRMAPRHQKKTDLLPILDLEH